jgi:hypothetical protein
MSAQSFA